MTKIAIVDYGAGNLGSVARALAAIGVDARVVTSGRRGGDADADKVVFPGVGAAGQAMAAVRERGLDDLLRAHAARERPLLGICVGMQILGEHSEEDDVACLGLLPFRITKLRVDEPVPHMGWNSLAWNGQHAAIALRRGLPEAANVYYVHSYAAQFVGDTPAYVAAGSEYGGQQFAGVVALGAVWGTQFHTEKSGRAGLQILRNFVESA
jgi:glutamine amidotransferase